MRPSTLETAGPAPGYRDRPQHRVSLEPCAKRVRNKLGERVVADSRAMKLLHETGFIPVYYFPIGDVDGALMQPSDTVSHCPFKGEARYFHLEADGRRIEDAGWTYPRPYDEAAGLAGHAAFFFRKMDSWWEEEEQIHVHARDPYVRIDILQSSRKVTVTHRGETLARSTRPLILFETKLPPRLYLPRDDVAMDTLTESRLTTQCPYKGTASYFSTPGLENVAWSYPAPLPEVGRIRDHVSFHPDKVAVAVDGDVLQEPPPPNRPSF